MVVEVEPVRRASAVEVAVAALPAMAPTVLLDRRRAPLTAEQAERVVRTALPVRRSFTVQVAAVAPVGLAVMVRSAPAVQVVAAQRAVPEVATDQREQRQSWAS